MKPIFLGLGSNLGDRQGSLAQAVLRLSRLDGLEVRRVSSVYESPPVGPPQPDYLNLAVKAETTLDWQQLLVACKAIERDLGRVPAERWGPRAIDIDLLFADEIVAFPDLQIPHLELHKRVFALAPLCELAPDAVHPVLGARLAVLAAELGGQGVHRVGPLGLEF